jgi:hypothetical protein
MSSNSEIDLNEEFLDEWLMEQGFPTNVPLEMKILTYAGNLSFRQRVIDEISAEIELSKRKKFVTDGARRAAIFLTTENLLRSSGNTHPTKTEVIKFCIQTANILYSNGIISKAEKALWTKPGSVKSILDQLPKGFEDLEEFEQKCQKISRMTEKLSCT